MHKVCVLCGNIVCRHMEVSEGGKRMSDTVNNLRMSHDYDAIKNCWMAFALEDGSSNGVVYDTRSDAVRHHTNRAQKYFYCALRAAIHGMTAKEGTLALAMHRVQAERGRYHPESGLDPIMPVMRETYNAELASTKMNAPAILPGLADLLARLN